jgi:hypothetical protein
MTALVILLMTTAVPSADAVPSTDPVAQPPPTSTQRFSHMRRLFGRQSQGPQQQPGCACGVRPAPVAVTGGAAGPITPPVMSQGPQQQPGGGAGRVVPVPVSGTPSATEASPAISRPHVTTPPVSPEMRRMPVGPAEGEPSPF